MRTLPLVAIILLATTAGADAARVADITRLSGQRTNVLTGVGLVVGLKGTGDGGDFLPAIKPLAAMLTRFRNPTQVVDLKNAANVAIVNLIAVVPSQGVRNGDHLDVRVMSCGAATSLKGGILFVTPMQGPIPEAGGPPRLPLAFSSGSVVIEDPTAPNVGVVAGGCAMEEDLLTRTVDDGRLTLILDEASAGWPVSSMIATLINESEGDGTSQPATALDGKNVLVTIPPEERAQPAAFIARVQRLQLRPINVEARVVLNERTGAIVLTGDVEVSPVVISQNGLTISTFDPKPVPTPQRPVLGKREVVTIDTVKQGGAKLQDLALAFDQLKVPPADRVAIVKDLYRSGHLHAKLIINGAER
jgi:flagellar P-ring protein precursor FlgI